MDRKDKFLRGVGNFCFPSNMKNQEFVVLTVNTRAEGRFSGVFIKPFFLKIAKLNITFIYNTK